MPGSRCGGLVAHDAAYEWHRPAGDVVDVPAEIVLDLVWEAVPERRNNVGIGGGVRAEPVKCLNYRGRWFAGPLHYPRSAVSEPNRSVVDLQCPGGAVGEVARLCRHCIGETEAICSSQPIRHDPHAVPSRQRSYGGVYVGWRRSVQPGAEPRHVVEALPDPAQRSGLGQARQCLVNRIAAAEAQKVSGGAHPCPRGALGHLLSDLIRYGCHGWPPFASFGLLI